MNNEMRPTPLQLRKTGQRWLRYGAVISILLIGGGIAAYWWYLQPRAADVSYQQCQIQYGDVVTEWDGTTQNEPWNNERYHYQLRRFSLRATAPQVFFPNTIESPPTRIATGGDHACKHGFDETVDVTEPQYRWYGSRATAVRLGMPAVAPGSGSTFVSGATEASDSELTTPVFQQSRAAAVWVNDGGLASLRHNGQRMRWWCINAPGCEDIADQGSHQPLRGSGYQYVADNCPSGVSCHDNWYDQIDTPDVLGRSYRMLQPFQMRLSAVSTYADKAGTAVVAAFKYPKRVSLQANFMQQPDRITPGETFQTNLKIRKRGPSVDSLSLTADTSAQPIAEIATKTFDQQQLTQLNTEDTLTIPISLPVQEQARPGACYRVAFSLIAADVETPFAEPEMTYCVAAKETIVRYQVDTRGDIEADLRTFKSQVAATLRDSRGWAAANTTFTRVNEGGDFTLWLAAPATLPKFSSGCSSQYSCRVGSHVIINNSRWQNATPAWREAGGDLRNYRHMVINHEVGHFLGLGHATCPSPERAAPVMMQQSIDLNGCRFNPWPLPNEIERVAAQT